MYVLSVRANICQIKTAITFCHLPEAVDVRELIRGFRGLLPGGILLK